jgi:hypothetical protein
MLRWLQHLLTRRRPGPLPTISADVTGFTVTLDRHSRAVPWSSVSKVAAFKQDLRTYDRIVLLFEVATGGDPLLTLSEDCPGFAGLFGPMEEGLGINPSWYLDIMTPAFEPTPIVLYVRSEESPGLPSSGE